MNQVRAEALKLRIQGYSYNEILKRLGIPKSTQSSWFKNLQLSENAYIRLEKRKGVGTDILIKRNIKQTSDAQKRAKESQEKASRVVGKLSSRDILLVGAALYWGEGYKRLRTVSGKQRTHHSISMVNADPILIKAFIKFMVDILEVKMNEIKASMRLYRTINEGAAREYWASETGLPALNFRKTAWLVSISSQRKKKYNRLPYGSLQVEVSNTNNFHKVMGFIKGIKSAIH